MPKFKFKFPFYEQPKNKGIHVALDGATVRLPCRAPLEECEVSVGTRRWRRSGKETREESFCWLQVFTVKNDETLSASPSVPRSLQAGERRCAAPQVYSFVFSKRFGAVNWTTPHINLSHVSHAHLSPPATKERSWTASEDGRPHGRSDPGELGPFKATICMGTTD